MKHFLSLFGLISLKISRGQTEALIICQDLIK